MTQPPNPNRPAMTEAEREAMVALADACEKATGPDRELDGLIANACTKRVPAWHADWRVPLPYTASLDATMTLVPDGMVWSVMTDYELPGRASVYGWHNETDMRPPVLTRCDAATPALALTAAAIRARANQGTPA